MRILRGAAVYGDRGLRCGVWHNRFPLLTSFGGKFEGMFDVLPRAGGSFSRALYFYRIKRFHRVTTRRYVLSVEETLW